MSHCVISFACHETMEEFWYNLIKNKTTWHVTPCSTDIWLGPPEMMEHVFEDHWRQEHGMSHGFLRFGQEKLSSWNDRFCRSENAISMESMTTMHPCNCLRTDRVSNHTFWLDSPIFEGLVKTSDHHCQLNPVKITSGGANYKTKLLQQMMKTDNYQKCQLNHMKITARGNLHLLHSIATFLVAAWPKDNMVCVQFHFYCFA